VRRSRTNWEPDSLRATSPIPPFPDRLVAETLAAFGGLDILVNNAGITHRGSLLETSDDDWTRVMDVNVTALMRCSRAALKHMVAAGKGSIVNIASDFAVVAGQGEAVYCASKGAVLQLTRAMALDHGPQGVRINAVCPGDVENADVAGGHPIARRGDRRRSGAEGVQLSPWGGSADRPRLPRWLPSSRPTPRAMSRARPGWSMAATPRRERPRRSASKRPAMPGESGGNRRQHRHADCDPVVHLFANDGTRSVRHVR